MPYVSSKEIAHFCGFLLVFIGVLIAGAIIGHLFGRLVKAAGLTRVRSGPGRGLRRGARPAARRRGDCGDRRFRPGTGDAPPRAVVHSRFAPYVIDTAHVFASMAPRELKDSFRKHYGQVKSIWDDAVKKGRAARIRKFEPIGNERDI